MKERSKHQQPYSVRNSSDICKQKSKINGHLFNYINKIGGQTYLGGARGQTRHVAVSGTRRFPRHARRASGGRDWPVAGRGDRGGGGHSGETN